MQFSFSFLLFPVYLSSLLPPCPPSLTMFCYVAKIGFELIMLPRLDEITEISLPQFPKWFHAVWLRQPTPVTSVFLARDYTEDDVMDLIAFSLRDWGFMNRFDRIYAVFLIHCLFLAFVTCFPSGIDKSSARCSCLQHSLHHEARRTFSSLENIRFSKNIRTYMPGFCVYSERFKPVGRNVLDLSLLCGHKVAPAWWLILPRGCLVIRRK